MSKPSLSIAQQIELLRGRGFDGAVSDSVLARFLYDHSYYRASGYWRYFQVAPHDGDNRFEPGVTLDRIRDLYRFDAAVRSIVMDGLSDLEIAVRARLGHHSLSVLRNVCAHHGRIWNRVVAVKPFVLNRLRTEADPSIYLGTPWGWFVVLADLVDGVRGGSGFSTKLFDFIAGHPEWEDGLKHPHPR
ncbi:Abi-like protein [Rathayibacter sp. PhB151]|uniref:Abi family protein n=1 Tax=Rathayibacter sp. PhB151 TaxID=2485189 RepID=UPI0010644253|nr:Abi family protein [Rathayibacter sp. PhB151]TDX81317.1 Abi-like protein [Rathayibacter sp. PhB151]